MFCCSSKKGSNIYENLNVNITLTPALSETIGGSICCECANAFRYEWKQNGSTALLELSSDRSCAFNVPSGNYQIEIYDINNYCIISNVTMYTANIPRVVDYHVEHASSDVARDGKIQVITEDLTEACKYLWTTGVITETNELHDVMPGTYAVTLISNECVPILFYHTCNPAIVDIK